MATSLISLPDEHKLNILRSVDIGPENTLLELRSTHPWLRASISTEKFRTRSLAAEKDTELVPSSHFVCYTYLRVLPADNFADNSTKTPKGLGGKQAHKRFCVHCGVRHGKYSPGSEGEGEEASVHKKRGRGPNYAKRVEAMKKYVVVRRKFEYDDLWDESDGGSLDGFDYEDLSDGYFNRDSDV
ncbi:hypothetical protein Q9189_004473 [Teloschistes chrysophthalmus]